MTTDFAPGALVRARGREWVVLADSDSDFLRLRLRPLGGTEDEVTGIYLPLEKVESAVFGLPSPEHPGDHRSSRLLREAARLGFRATTGPFRSFASLGVEPRPYQLVPLLMALKLDPVRLLIADDVGLARRSRPCWWPRKCWSEARPTASRCFVPLIWLSIGNGKCVESSIFPPSSCARRFRQILLRFSAMVARVAAVPFSGSRSYAG